MMRDWRMLPGSRIAHAIVTNKDGSRGTLCNRLWFWMSDAHKAKRGTKRCVRCEKCV